MKYTVGQTITGMVLAGIIFILFVAGGCGNEVAEDKWDGTIERSRWSCMPSGAGCLHCELRPGSGPGEIECADVTFPDGTHYDLEPCMSCCGSTCGSEFCCVHVITSE
jgi:hypothetical protein